MIPPEPNDPRPAADRALGSDIHPLLAQLNEPQRRGVTHGAGPLLVLAGAGSGKTRVITHRIAYLIHVVGVPPSRIVAVTFTNKAAAEMRERVARLLGTSSFESWIGTFHALCLRLLRRDGERIGLQRGFNIYDTDDQIALVKRILKAEGVDKIHGTPRAFLSRISRAKNALVGPAEFEKLAHSPEARLQAQVYQRYEAALRLANVVDFDDLLVRTLELFQAHPEVARGYASRCEHLLVDEYQDTNRPQYLLIRHLTGVHGNICVVGDEDQSIYGFRGAEIRNILEFEEDHQGTQTIRLEQNYRSSGTIITAASAVIANNRYRKGKTLWTENAQGDPIDLFRAPDDRAEAIWVAQRVAALEGRFAYESMAVLYRTNAQSRQLEEIFRRDRIPYQIVGAVQFYERKEIKDILGYLKLAANPADDVSFRRVVNTPPRGIGATTLRLLEDVARGLGLPLTAAARHALEQQLLSGRAVKMLSRFLDLLDDLSRRSAEDPVASLIERVVEAVDYEDYLEKTYDGQGAARMENVSALINAAAEYAEEADTADLQGFLDRSALVADADEVGRRPGVTLMTVHCAKGLEFPVVFLVGLEENVFPHAMSSASEDDVEEERRLCYVAMTRAMRRLSLSHALLRRSFGALIPNPPSRFLEEAPQELIREVASDDRGFFGAGDLREGAAYAGGGSSAALAARKRRPRRAPAGSKTPAGPPPEDGFAIGASVLHPRFGGGTILNREGKGKHLKLTIDFSDYGPKKILPSYTKLQVRIG